MVALPLRSPCRRARPSPRVGVPATLLAIAAAAAFGTAPAAGDERGAGTSGATEAIVDEVRAGEPNAAAGRPGREAASGGKVQGDAGAAAPFAREVAPGHFVHVGRHADMSVANGGVWVELPE